MDTTGERPYRKTIVVTITNKIVDGTDKFIRFVWADTNIAASTAFPRNTKFPVDKLQVGKTYCAFTEKMNGTWDWVRCYEIDTTKSLSA